MPRQLIAGTAAPRTTRVAGWYQLAALIALCAGCKVNSLGLNEVPDARGSDAPATDLPVDTTPGDAGGRDVTACGPCDSAATFIILPGGRFKGSTAPAAERRSANQGSCGGDGAPEAVFRIELFTPSDLFITTHGTGFDTVVYLRRGCCADDEVACNDNADGRATSMIAERGLAAGTYYIYVDGATSADAGDFTLDVYATPMAAHAGEACGRPERIAADPVIGDTCGAHDDYSPPVGCSQAVAGPNGLDQVYYFVLDAPSTVTFSTCNNTCIDSVLYLREVCSDGTGASARGCDDDACRASGACQPAGQVQSRLSVALDAGVHYLVLDTFTAAQGGCGAFTITPTGVTP